MSIDTLQITHSRQGRINATTLPLPQEGGQDFMRTLQRFHGGGTEAVLRQTADGWRVQIDIKNPDRSPVTVGFQRPTLELAQSFADNEILNFGHVCNVSCKDWVEALSSST